MGGIAKNMKKVLKEMGLREKGAARVITELHDNALKWLVKLVETERKLNGWGGEGLARGKRTGREANEEGRIQTTNNAPRPGQRG